MIVSKNKLGQFENGIGVVISTFLTTFRPRRQAAHFEPLTNT